MQFPAFPGMLKNRTTSEIAQFIGTMQAAGLDPVAVATIIEYESAHSWSPSIHGPKAFTDAPGYAVGLIQFAPRTADDLGTSTAALERMTFLQQLSFVVKYFRDAGIARLKRLVDYYAAVFHRAAIGTPDSFVIAKAGDPIYDNNKGLDRDKTGQITTGDLAATMAAVLASAQGAIAVTPRAIGTLSGKQAAVFVVTLAAVAGAVTIWRRRR